MMYYEVLCRRLHGGAEESREKYTYESRESGPRIKAEITEHMMQKFQEL